MPVQSSKSFRNDSALGDEEWTIIAIEAPVSLAVSAVSAGAVSGKTHFEAAHKPGDFRRIPMTWPTELRTVVALENGFVWILLVRPCSEPVKEFFYKLSAWE